MAEHEKDFHNNFIKQPQALVGPREPWHDIHSKVEGPIAQDVFANFFERWRKQCKNEVRLDPLDPNLFDLNCLPPFTGLKKSDYYPSDVKITCFPPKDTSVYVIKEIFF